jgi:hypothetical protein
MRLKDTLLLETLAALSKKELGEFAKFADSPFYNKGRNYLPLLNELKKFHPGYSSDKLSSEYIYGKLFPGRKFNLQVFKNLTGGLMRILEEYLVQFGIKRQKSEYLLQLADELQYRRIFRSAGKMIKKTYKYLKEEKYDTLYFGKMSRLIHIESQFVRNRNDFIQTAMLETGHANYHFLKFYTELGHMLSEMSAMEINMNLDLKNSELLNLAGSKIVTGYLNTLKARTGENPEILEIYRLILKLLTDQYDEASFFKIYSLFKKNLDQFNRIGMNQLFIILFGSSNRLESVDKDKYRRVSFDLMKLMLGHEAYSAGSHQPMNLATFRNIFVCSVSLKEFRWAESFLKEHIDKLLPEHRDNMYNYSMSHLSFEKREFNAALAFLAKVKYDMFALKYDTKVLLLRIYYELELFEQAYSHIDTFKHFINENKLLSPRKRNVQKNFLKFTEALLKLKEGKKIPGLDELTAAISGSGSLVEKTWLLEKVKELSRK